MSTETYSPSGSLSPSEYVKQIALSTMGSAYEFMVTREFSNYSVDYDDGFELSSVVAPSSYFYSYRGQHGSSSGYTIYFYTNICRSTAINAHSKNGYNAAKMDRLNMYKVNSYLHPVSIELTGSESCTFENVYYGDSDEVECYLCMTSSTATYSDDAFFITDAERHPIIFNGTVDGNNISISGIEGQCIIGTRASSMPDMQYILVPFA